ncbi:hypothetical protein LLG95_14735, partial [bacterium]|nr:hypothetical protein [bacterium]
IPPAPVRQPSIREIAELPAMPLARIADELNRITTALSQDLIAVPFSSSIGPMQSISPISPNPEPTIPSHSCMGSAESNDTAPSSITGNPALANHLSPTDSQISALAVQPLALTTQPSGP